VRVSGELSRGSRFKRSLAAGSDAHDEMVELQRAG
jgi:hypothetical protein